MANERYVLLHRFCDECVWGEDSHYNAACAHCPYCTYSKSTEPMFLTRRTAEQLGLVEPKKVDSGEST